MEVDERAREGAHRGSEGQVEQDDSCLDRALVAIEPRIRGDQERPRENGPKTERREHESQDGRLPSNQADEECHQRNQRREESQSQERQRNPDPRTPAAAGK